ncbi:hypothetical protein [Natronobacterium texcoconense]|uniref:Uncharacterized protein n=1 Tax=Natronobacterium texcoconense TaxID=1095778 RepID=A0A1H0ZAS9_NATTX|nr:hypothetical protein [Natronobacterium texcoconense]SDQ24186.1 hypothetical protein SAMN04489842_0194 [Natronobacterium texcoconense]
MVDRTQPSRRTALRTIGSLATVLTATGVAGARSSPSADSSTDCRRNAQRYVATVDRIVDGRHVVLLLEEDGETVDQLVVPAEEMDVEETDILIVLVEDDELLAYWHIPERPSD